MRQISATMIIPFEFANLAKKNRIIAIFHNKTHATTQLFHLKHTHRRPPTHKKTSSLYFLMYFF